MRFYEHCRTVKARNGKFVPQDELTTLKGFQSVYGFDENVASIMSAQKNSTGMKRYEPSSDVLYVDFDDQPDEALKLEEKLLSAGYTYEIYDSGNRSYHFHIPHVYKCSKDLPHTHREVLRVLGVNMDLVDKTLYRPNSLFRIAGTFHHKTGKPKILLRRNEGILLDFSVIPTPTYDFENVEGIGVYNLTLELFLIQILNCVVSKAATGSRHDLMFKTACNCYDIGLDANAAVVFCGLLNEDFPEPKPQSEVERAVEGAYQYMRGITGG
jgi:hypothetical protein